MSLYAALAHRIAWIAGSSLVLALAVGASVALALHVACVRRDLRARRKVPLAPARITSRGRRRSRSCGR